MKQRPCNLFHDASDAGVVVFSGSYLQKCRLGTIARQRKKFAEPPSGSWKTAARGITLMVSRGTHRPPKRLETKFERPEGPKGRRENDMAIRNAGIFTTISRAAILATILVASAGVAQAADSDHVAPPSAADVAILRGLLALQHPALRQASASVTPAPAAIVPAVTTEPGQSKDARQGEA
jgi:hypothetical protein